MYSKSYPMGLVIHESLWWRRSAGNFSIPLTPSEQSEVVPKHGACSKKDFTNSCNVVRISVFAADENEVSVN